jgi:hypothetical protein
MTAVRTEVLTWRGLDHPPTPSAEVKERVQLYLYSKKTYVHWALLGLEPITPYSYSFLPVTPLLGLYALF